MIVFFVPLGLALLYCLRGRIVMLARKARRRVDRTAVCTTSGTTDCTCVEMPQREFARCVLCLSRCFVIIFCFVTPCIFRCIMLRC